MQIAYSLLLAAVPVGTILPITGYQWSGAFYFLFLAVWTVYVGSHRRFEPSSLCGCSIEFSANFDQELIGFITKEEMQSRFEWQPTLEFVPNLRVVRVRKPGSREKL